MRTSVFSMSNDPTTRRLLPQTSQVPSFSFAPPAYQQQPRETQKSAPCVKFSIPQFLPVISADPNSGIADYVFVDEHNRHKRLKGMKFISHLEPLTSPSPRSFCFFHALVRRVPC